LGKKKSQIGGLDKYYLEELVSLFFLSNVLTMLQERKVTKKGYNIIGGNKNKKKNSSWKLNHVLQMRGNKE
jgi:hypothetical protein